MIEIKEVTKKFGNHKAIDTCTLTLNTGKIYGLLGPNGSGKSTLMKTVAGLFKASKGTILIDGELLSYRSKASLAFMSTEAFMYDYMTLKQVADYFEDFYEDFSRNKFEELMKDFELKQSLKVKNLSTGMHSKLKIAATLARGAKYFMFDEPLNGIDLLARDQIMKAIINVATEDNMILLSSHFIEQMENILDEIIFIKEGKIELMGNAEQIRQERKVSIVDLYKEVFVGC